MSSALPSACSCPTPVAVSVPGAQGDAGTNGTNGADGENAYCVTTTDFTNPAKSATSGNITVSNAGWMVVGQAVFVEGAGYFTVATVSGTTATLTYLNYAINTNDGNTVYAGAKISPSGTQPATDAILPVGSGGTGVNSYASLVAALGLGQDALTVSSEGIGQTLADQATTYLSSATTITGMTKTVLDAGKYLVRGRCVLDYIKAKFVDGAAAAFKGMKITLQINRVRSGVADAVLATTDRTTGVFDMPTITTSTSSNLFSFPSQEISIPDFSADLLAGDVLQLRIYIEGNATSGKCLIDAASLALLPLAI